MGFVRKGRAPCKEFELGCEQWGAIVGACRHLSPHMRAPKKRTTWCLGHGSDSKKSAG